MAIEADIGPIVQKHTELPFERLRIVQTPDILRLTDIRAAVLFVFAAWSGPSTVALKRVTRLLSTLERGLLDVIILDNDCMSGDEMVQLFGHVFHGGGDTIWIRKGRVIAEVIAYLPASEPSILKHTKELLGDSTN